MAISDNIFKALTDAATQIRDEKRTGANTAYRVGSFLLALCKNISPAVEDLSPYFLRKDKEDVAQEIITFLKGIVTGLVQSPDFSPGELGSGFVIKNDGDSSYMEIDRLLVRRVAYFVELIIKSLKHVGGTIVLTPASMRCSRVEEHDAFYRCFFERERDGKTINQEFVAGDQARSQTFNVKEGVSHNVGSQFYWRLVIEVGEDYIDLSKADCATGSMPPLAGDDIVQLGNREDPARQHAIILSAYGDDAPSFKQYTGICDYSLSGKEVTIISRVLNSFTGRFRSSVTGEDYDMMFDAFKTDLSKVKAQTDKEYSIWFYNYVPTLQNEPASGWSDQDKIDHEYDIFYYPDEGLAWRFVSGKWEPITDQQTIKALEKAAKAQDTADGKRRNFVDIPVPPYDNGDTWSNAFYGTLYNNDDLVCINSKKEGEAFSIDDWQPVSDMNSGTKKIFESLFEQLEDSITLQVTKHDELQATVTALGIRIDGAEDTLLIYGEKIDAAEGSITSLGLRLDTAEDAISIYAERFADNEASISALQVDLASVNTLVVAAQVSADDAMDVANAARSQAVTASMTGMYSGEEYNQTSNPWQEWPSGQEYKHVGAIWYNPDTGVTKRYTGTDNSNSWETVTDADEVYASATYVFQNKNKWSAIASNFKADGTPATTSGFVTTANFAGLFSEQIDEEGIATRAEISTYVDDAMSHIMITADRIDINGIMQVAGTNSVTIGGFTISSNSLTNNAAGNSSTGASIEIMNSSGTRLARLNGGVQGNAAEFRNDSGTAVVISAYGDASNYGLKVVGNVDSKAVHVTGSSFFITRKSNVEHTYISGLKVCTRTGDSLSASYDSYDPYFPSGTNVDFLVATGSVTLPEPTNARGRVIFVKRRNAGSTKLVVPNCYLADGSFEESAEWNDDDASRIFISDGMYWNEFYCK